MRIIKELEVLTTRGIWMVFINEAHEDYQSCHPKQLNEISQRFVEKSSITIQNRLG